MNFYENLTNNLYNFFTCFPEYVERWDATAEKTSTEIQLLLSYSETYVDLTNTKTLFNNLVAENSTFTHVRHKSLTAVALHIEETMMKIREHQDSLYAIVEDLLTKQDAIERAASKLPEIDSACKFYNIPRLNRLREYSEDATKFFQCLSGGLSEKMNQVKNLDQEVGNYAFQKHVDQLDHVLKKISSFPTISYVNNECYLQIDTAMSNVDYLQTFSIKDVLKTWNQKASSHVHIREILAYITFTNSQNAA